MYRVTSSWKNQIFTSVALLAALVPQVFAEDVSPAKSSKEVVLDAEAAITRLTEGNRRFFEGVSRHPHESINYRHSLVNAQHPFATILACSDSRVTPVLVFDQGVGDLFVIRVAGNVIDVDVAGSIEYAVDHLDTHLLVVMGHTHCGAVTAAYHAFALQDSGDQEPEEIISLLRRIGPAVKDLDPSLPLEAQIEKGVEPNVRLAIEELRKVSDLAHAEAAGKVRLVGAVYDLATGEVRWLED